MLCGALTTLHQSSLSKTENRTDELADQDRIHRPFVENNIESSICELEAVHIHFLP